MGMKAARLYGGKVVNCKGQADLSQFVAHASVPAIVVPDVVHFRGRTFILDADLSAYVIYREAISFEYAKAGG